MTGNPATAPLVGGVALLERSLGYTYGCLQLVTAAAMTNPTPCRDWDLRALLAHMDDSLAALQEAGETGEVALATAGHGAPARDPVATLRNRACTMLGGWADTTRRAPVTVAGRPVTAPVVTVTGAIEIAVHGWDVAQACGRPRRIPKALADELLPLVTPLVTPQDRPVRFAPPLPVATDADADERLLALLGRSPTGG